MPWTRVPFRLVIVRRILTVLLLVKGPLTSEPFPTEELQEKSVPVGAAYRVDFAADPVRHRLVVVHCELTLGGCSADRT
ncbi:hypothetical protein GALMADRAFT_239114 [Galerina marginata CBS 339.88]|uniref:Secreted protein n=1 Tax=Galerina marginata (strain CBS 339.88) TaxID=685588 RepID=A0A067TTJ6_GALM3|nr:hypothetical protein GALMADRAFT_239114 [Galerina marginata CBS 339.88]